MALHFLRLLFFSLLFLAFSLFLSSSIAHPLHPEAKLRSLWRRRQRWWGCCRRLSSCCCFPSGPKWPASTSSMSATMNDVVVAVAAEDTTRPGVQLRGQGCARHASHHRSGSTRERWNASGLFYSLGEQKRGSEKALFDRRKRNSERADKKKQKRNFVLLKPNHTYSLL